MLFLVQGEMTVPADPTREFLEASRATLQQLTKLQQDGTLKAGGVYVGPLGVCFIADVASNDDLHVLLTTLPSFVYASWDVMPLIPFERDIEMSLDDAIDRASD
ncbi:MAG: muconolactone Delta-isomerase family protein [Actinomycetota bacterium]